LLQALQVLLDVEMAAEANGAIAEKALRFPLLNLVFVLNNLVFILV
jgi:hypothetical protein